jgi:hypothetical protein
MARKKKISSAADDPRRTSKKKRRKASDTREIRLLQVLSVVVQTLRLGWEIANKK